MSEKNPELFSAVRLRRTVDAGTERLTIASKRFDDRIAGLLALFVTTLEKTSLAANPRVANWIEFLRAPGSDFANVDGGIVSQANPAPKLNPASPPPANVSAKAVRLLSTGIRVGIVSLVVLMLVLSWPKGNGGPTTSRAAARNTPTATATSSLAIINPVNVGDTASRQPSIVSSSGSLDATEEGAGEAPMVVVNALPESGLFDGESAGDDSNLITDTTGQVQPSAVEIVPIQAQEEEGQVVLIDADMAGAESRDLIAPTPVAPFVNIVSTINFNFTPTPVPQPTSDAPPTPTPLPIKLEPGRLWSNFEPKRDNDHFWVQRPFSEQIRGQLASPNYQFGSTAGGRYRIHHGMDISNPQGTPVRAATIGEVIHAGWDEPELIGPYNGFYGNVVVIQLDQRLPVAGGEMNVYLLYGHLSEVLVEKGQRVQPDDIVGRVGMTGIAIGPHLHVEMRLGANTYEHSVDPYLWVEPKDSAGAVAVRLLTADGRTWPGARLSLARFEGGRAVWARVIETYRDTETIGPDPVWGENGAMGSVPPGYYILAGSVNGENVRTELIVEPEKTTFVELRTTQ